MMRLKLGLSGRRRSSLCVWWELYGRMTLGLRRSGVGQRGVGRAGQDNASHGAQGRVTQGPGHVDRKLKGPATKVTS